MDIQTIGVIALAVLAVSQFVTMVSNVTGNIAHRQQMKDVRAMRVAQERDLAADAAFRESVREDCELARTQLAEMRTIIDGTVWVNVEKADVNGEIGTSLVPD